MNFEMLKSPSPTPSSFLHLLLENVENALVSFENISEVIPTPVSVTLTLMNYIRLLSKLSVNSTVI